MNRDPRACRLPSFANHHGAELLNRVLLSCEANQHSERAQQLLRQGDWTGYREEMRRLGKVLKKLSAQQAGRTGAGRQ